MPKLRSSDGNTLVVSSTDGYCSIINFKKGELGEIYKPREELVKEISINKIEPKTEPDLPNEDGRLKTTNTKNYSEFDKYDTSHKENDLIITEKKATEPQDSTEEPMEVNLSNSINNSLALLNLRQRHMIECLTDSIVLDRGPTYYQKGFCRYCSKENGLYRRTDKAIY